MRLLRNNAWNGIPSGGFVVGQGGTKGLRGILENMKDAPSGVPVLDDNQQMKPGDIPLDFLNYTPMLEGPKSNFIGVPFLYQITNFGFNRDYTLEFDSGSISRDHDIISVAPDFAGDHVFRVNGREFLITVVSGVVQQPNIESVSETSTVVGGVTTYSLNARASGYSSSGVEDDVHASSFWQVATDIDFTNIIVSTTVTSGDKRNAVLQTMTQRPVVFVRVRYTGSILGNSLWSVPVRFANASVLEGSNNNDRYGFAIDCSGGAEKVIVGSPGFGTIDDAGTGLVSILRNTGSSYSEEISFSSGNQSSTANLTIPTGGSIQIQLDSNPPFNQTFTNTGVVNLPDWNQVGKFFGKGGPGTRTYIDPIPAIPQKGQPGYPQGLPPYQAASQSFSGQALAWTNYVGNWNVYATGINSVSIDTRAGCVSTAQVSYVVYEQGDPNLRPTGMSVSWSVTDVTGGAMGGDGSGSVYLSNSAMGNPQQGDPAYPSGLPPYEPAVPEVPGYYIDHQGPSSTAVINGRTYTFAGGYGAVPAVVDEKRIYANANDGFGSSVAISKNYLVAAAGSPNDKHQTVLNAGSCFVSRNVSNNWLAPVRLAQPTPVTNALFGTSVDLNQLGNTAFVGSPGENKVYVFKNDVYAATIQVVGLNGASKFGERVSCSDDGKVVAISSPWEVNGAYQGKVRVFKENGSGVWELAYTVSPTMTYETIAGTVPEGATFRIEQRGTDDALISTHAITDSWTLNNATRSIRLVGNGAETIGYMPLGPLDPENPIYPPEVWGEDANQIGEIAGMEMFPYSEEGSTESAFTITYLGNTYTFTYNAQETSYEFSVVRYVGEFGTSISLSEDGLRLAVGAPVSRIHNENQGFVSLFDLNGSVREQRFIGPAPYGSFRYGKSVSLDDDGNKLLITEPARNSNVGSYDVWTIDENPNNHTRVTTKPNTTVNTGGFGNAAVIDSNGVTKVFGDPLFSNNRGRVYVL